MGTGQGVPAMKVWICFEQHAHDGRVWSVRFRGKWRTVKSVTIDARQAQIETVYRGPKARQPRAYLSVEASDVQGDHERLTVFA